MARPKPYLIAGLVCLACIAVGGLWELVAGAAPEAAVSAGAPLRGASPSELLAAEANRLSAESILIAYRQSILAALGVLTSIVTLFSAIAAAIYAKAASAQARRSADIAQSALVASDRAWVSVEVMPVGPLHLHPVGGLSIEIGVRIKNIGKSPALNVHTNVDQISLDLLASAEHLRTFADTKRVINTSASRLLLPDQEYVRPWVAIGPIPDEAYPLFPIIVGTVTYQLSIDETLHQTSFSVTVARKDAKPLALGCGEEIPSDELAFLPVAGAFAD